MSVSRLVLSNLLTNTSTSTHASITSTCTLLSSTVPAVLLGLCRRRLINWDIVIVIVIVSTSTRGSSTVQVQVKQRKLSTSARNIALDNIKWNQVVLNYLFEQIRIILKSE